MSQEQCIRALAEHAGIKPLVTVTGHSLSSLEVVCGSVVLKPEERYIALVY